MIQSPRSYGTTENTTHRWKSKFGGMGVSEAKRLEELSTALLNTQAVCFRRMILARILHQESR